MFTIKRVAIIISLATDTCMLTWEVPIGKIFRFLGMNVTISSRMLEQRDIFCASGFIGIICIFTERSESFLSVISCLLQSTEIPKVITF